MRVTIRSISHIQTGTPPHHKTITRIQKHAARERAAKHTKHIFDFLYDYRFECYLDDDGRGAVLFFLSLWMCLEFLRQITHKNRIKLCSPHPTAYSFTECRVQTSQKPPPKTHISSFQM